MAQHLAEDTYRFDRTDPRSPSQAQWDRMSPEEHVGRAEQRLAEVLAEIARFERKQ